MFMIYRFFSTHIIFVALVLISTSAFAQKQSTPEILKSPPVVVQPDENSLTSHNHYTNKHGAIVHSPAKSKTGTLPKGASAKCGDGSYSFSRSRRGTCSHHGGVAEWQ